VKASFLDMTHNHAKDNNQLQASFATLLSGAAEALASYLDRLLPSLFDNWWKDAVRDKLSFQQQRRVEQKGIVSLSSLDLAALLRVLDQNWYQISMKMNLSPEARHFVKEMQTVRNRWAHAGTEGVPLEDVYRDLDTLQRFATVIEAEEAFIQEIRATKTSLLERRLTSISKASANEEQPTSGEGTQAAEFEPGQIVFLKSNPEIKGAVVSIMPGKPENRYNVFIDGETRIFYASQIHAEDRKDKDSIVLPCHKFHSYLTALQIQHPGLSTLYSLNAARVDFIPYQFRPVLKFIRSDRPRLLIADGVGVGKTIEAGLILRELQARRDVRSVLIVCPRPLVTERKWQIEMKRFEERFAHLDGRTLRFCINEMDLEGVWPEQYQKAIIPYSLFDEALLYGTSPDGKRKRKKGLLDLDPPPRFDLVIVDEAHHIRNSDTYSHKAVRFFCDHAEAVVFLTATPIQMGNYDLFVLLNVLRPDLIIDQESFAHMAEPNPFINRAVDLARGQGAGWAEKAVEALDEAAATSWGRVLLRNSPEFSRIRDQLSRGDIPSGERVQLITDLEALHTFAGIINRTRRRDIGDFTVRKPETVVIEFTPAQKKLHDDLLQIQAEIFSQIHGDTNVKFMMTTIRRQAASCLYGLVPFLQEILNRHVDELAWEEADNTGEAPTSTTVEAIEIRIRMILEQARNLDPEDPKLEALRKILKNKQELPNNKVMLFSSFRHTLHYLHQYLKADGFRIGLVHGGTPDEERIELRNRFELDRGHDDALDVLLFSEIGCEGLDYQFCDCIVNYDLPWNPMRVEQRIGRIDRNGQKSESIAIFNLITPGTVDADIYERCLLRIGVFNNALGGSEEILGEISREIRNIAENFNLSDAERREKLQQLADNQIRLMQEQEELEQKQVELFGIRLPEDQLKKEINEASSFWLSPEAIRNLITNYLQNTCGKEQEFILGEKPLKTLRLSQEARNRLLKDFQKLPRQNTSSYREWENWLKGGNPHLLITFDAACASQNPDAAFIMPLHPLVRQASRAFDTTKRVVTTLKVRDRFVPGGDYLFAIYQWQFHGIREDLVMCPVASSERITAHLGKLLEKAEENQTSVDNVPESSAWDELDVHHYKLWSEAREKHQRRTQELAQYRRESLTTSHRARISLLEEQLGQASNDKIRRMRQAQIAAAEADYARRIQELDIAMERADITAQPVAYGVIHIDGGLSDAE
jgi:superfamily II DNA or RNA helicase